MHTKIILSILVILLITGCGDDQATQVQQTNILSSINLASIEVTKVNTMYYRHDWSQSQQSGYRSTSDTIIQQVSFSDTVGNCGDKAKIIRNADSIMITCNLSRMGSSYDDHITDNKSILFILKNNIVQSIQYSSENGGSSKSGGQGSGTFSGSSFKTSFHIVNPDFKLINNEYVFEVSGAQILDYLTKVDSSKSNSWGNYGYPYPYDRSSGSSSGVVSLLPPLDESRIRIVLKP